MLYNLVFQERQDPFDTSEGLTHAYILQKNDHIRTRFEKSLISAPRLRLNLKQAPWVLIRGFTVVLFTIAAEILARSMANFILNK